MGQDVNILLSGQYCCLFLIRRYTTIVTRCDPVYVRIGLKTSFSASIQRKDSAHTCFHPNLLSASSKNLCQNGRKNLTRTILVMPARTGVLKGQRGENNGARMNSDNNRVHPDTNGTVVRPTLECTAQVKKQSPRKKNVSAIWRRTGSIAAISNTFQSRIPGYRKCRARS